MGGLLAWGFARVDLSPSGKLVKISIPAIHWRGAEAAYLNEALTRLRQRDRAAQGSELIIPLPGPARAILLENAPGPHRDILQAMTAEGPSVAYRLVVLLSDAPCRSIEAVYMKLLALSEGLTKPHTLDLSGIFALLPNLAWSGHTPYELDWLRANKTALQMAGTYPAIDYVDKFPRFLHHVVPADNTRLLDGGKVRLGAHVAPGTTLMPGASYINFNAGTLGPSMVEGRISSSATVGPGTDVGGGASILGVLSGGNATPIAIGGNCLLGANSVCGIPLGDGCILDAGVTVLAGSKLVIEAAEQAKIDAVNDRKLASGNKTLFKGKDIAGLNGLHIRFDSATGALMAFRSKHEIKLNTELH